MGQAQFSIRCDRNRINSAVLKLCEHLQRVNFHNNSDLMLINYNVDVLQTGFRFAIASDKLNYSQIRMAMLEYLEDTKG